MQIQFDEKKRLLLLQLEGDIDHHTCLEIAKFSDDMIRKYLPSIVVFDFEHVTFMDSSGIGMLLGRYKKLIRFGASAQICHIHGDLNRILKMSGIFKIIPFVEEVSIHG